MKTKKIVAIAFLLIIAFQAFGQSGKWAIKFQAGLYNGRSYDAADQSYLELWYNFGSDYVSINKFTTEVRIKEKQWGYLSLDAVTY